jgi:hypothetical protein
MPKALVKVSSYPISKILKTILYPKAKISESKHHAVINATLPFRIKVYNIGLQEYSATNPAPIGIAIIGLNNYVL